MSSKPGCFVICLFLVESYNTLSFIIVDTFVVFLRLKCSLLTYFSTATELFSNGETSKHFKSKALCILVGKERGFTNNYYFNNKL